MNITKKTFVDILQNGDRQEVGVAWEMKTT